MRSSVEVLAALERLETDILERPHMHSSSPATLEERLSELDALRDFFLQETDSIFPFRYFGFLARRGFGSARYTQVVIRQGKRPLTARQQFEAMAGFWRAYRKERSCESLHASKREE